MNYETISARIGHAITERENLLICGEPGGGKSALFAEAIERAGVRGIWLHPVVDSPIDYKGIPAVIDGRAEFLAYGRLREIITADQETAVVIDDIGQAPGAVQAALMQLVHGGRVGEHAIPVEKISWLAATNRRSDRSGVSGVLNALGSRFWRLSLDRDPAGWVNWYTRQELPPLVAAFIRLRPDLLYTTAGARDDVDQAVANPRTWHALGRLLATFPDAGAEDFAGYIGAGPAAEFVGFLKLAETLPDPREILNNPTTTKTPAASDSSSLYAVATAAAHVVRGDEQRAAAVMQYVRRLPAVFQALAVADICRRYPGAREFAPLAAWELDNQDKNL